MRGTDLPTATHFPLSTTTKASEGNLIVVFNEALSVVVGPVVGEEERLVERGGSVKGG